MEENKSNNFLVGIQCFTYNQAPYITDALNGFTMQQTTFPYIAMVVDDASTDGEQKVIAQYVEENFDTNNSEVAYKKETDYAHITYAQHKTNKNCYIVVLYLKENLYSKRLHDKKLEYLSQWRDTTKYEALCEGDDYWIDPLKLQKQVDFMEKHPDHTLCFHAHTDLYNDCRQIIVNRYKSIVEDTPKEDLILGGGGVMSTNSMLLKKLICDEQYQYEWAKKSLVGDYILVLISLTFGKVGFLPDNMSVYRRNAEGSWSSSYEKDLLKQINNLDNAIEVSRLYNTWSNNVNKVAIKKRIKKLQKEKYKTIIRFMIKKIFYRIQ